MTKLYSDNFQTTTGLNKAYKQLRAQLIKALGLTGSVRFSPECFTLEVLYTEAKQNNEPIEKWLPYTSDKATMQDRLNYNKGNQFRLSTAPLENMK